MSNILTYKLFEFNLFKKKGSNFENLKDTIDVETKTIEEYTILMRCLDAAGYVWIDKTPIFKNMEDWNNWFGSGYRFIHIVPTIKKIGHALRAENSIQLKDIISDKDMKYVESREKEREKEREKMRLKHVDIDPLGEEDW